MITIDPHHLKTITEILMRFVPDRVVCAFGSRVTGKAKKFSDLDIAIMGDVAVPLSTLANLREEFIESYLPFRVDVLDWATTSEEFRAAIIKQCEEIYRPGL